MSTEDPHGRTVIDSCYTAYPKVLHRSASHIESSIDQGSTGCCRMQSVTASEAPEEPAWHCTAVPMGEPPSDPATASAPGSSTSSSSARTVSSMPSIPTSTSSSSSSCSARSGLASSLRRRLARISTASSVTALRSSVAEACGSSSTGMRTALPLPSSASVNSCSAALSWS